MAQQRDIKQAMTMWGVPAIHQQILEQTNEMYKNKHGMLASIPLVCKGDKCPFYAVCTVDPSARIPSTRCLMEVSAILTRFEAHCKHFGIDLSDDYIKPKDLIDASMVRDLVDKEIQIIRAEGKIAISGDFMARHIAQVDKKGKAYYEDVIHPAAEFKNKLVEDKMKIMSKLNATRKDKADLLKGTDTYSDKAKGIIAKVQEKAGQLNLEDIGNINNSLSEFNNATEIIKKGDE